MAKEGSIGWKGCDFPRRGTMHFLLTIAEEVKRYSGAKWSTIIWAFDPLHV
jgi:hypothetical protein